MSKSIKFAGETINLGDVVDVECVCPGETDYEREAACGYAVQCFKPGPTITTYLTMRDGRLLSQARANPAYRP